MITFTLDMRDFETLADELRDLIIEDSEDMMTDVFTELTAPPPTGTPVDTGKARQGWQIDLSDPLAMEIYNREPHIGPLNDGHSKQTPRGFVERAVQKSTD